MTRPGVLRYRILRRLGRLCIRVAAIATFGNMPPFVSASVLVRDRELVLVVMDPIRREPILPGGHLKWAESPPQAAVREVWEETGYTIELQRLLGVYAGKEHAGEGGVVRLIYEGEVLAGQLTPSSEGEPRWILMTEVSESNTRDAPIVKDWLMAQDSSAFEG